jgi:hypothetical protein
MNIVKLKDVIMPDEYTISEFFNKNLKGKYAYWVKMRYIFPLDSLDYETYIKYEQMSDIQLAGHGIHKHIDLYGEDCCMIQFAKKYIDATETEMANDIHQFKTSNMYVADFDIDINDLRTFRTWLANELLLLNTGDNGNYLSLYTPDQIHMLEYYKNNMYDDVVKYLDRFGSSTLEFSTSNESGCNCCNNTINIGLITTDNCNANDIYRKNITAFMVETFSDINFWKACNKSFLTLFKRYIDNIKTTGLTMSSVTNTSFDTVCSCFYNENDSTFKKMLERLSISLQYIIDDNTSSHNNFIYDSFNDWAVNAYEKMYWK